MELLLKINSLEISLNNFCKLSCIGCPSLDVNSPYKVEINSDLLANKISKLQIDYIVLCGNSGEPLAHSNINYFLQQLVKDHPHTRIHVSTNGEDLFSILSEKTIEIIKKRVLFQVSVDGPNQKIHELTRRGGALEKVLSSIVELKKRSMHFEVVYSRHKDNESYAKETFDLIFDLVGEKLNFRDTTIVKEGLRPPTTISKKGNVSVLYGLDGKNTDYVADLGNMYIDTNGDCYPCVSFTKYKTKLAAPNILIDRSVLLFNAEFIKFKQAFCHTYQKEGDLRQCNLNCGAYKKFKYDSLEDLE